MAVEGPKAPLAGAPEVNFILCLPDREAAFRTILMELRDWDSRFDSAETIAELILSGLEDSSSVARGPSPAICSA